MNKAFAATGSLSAADIMMRNTALIDYIRGVREWNADQDVVVVLDPRETPVELRTAGTLSTTWVEKDLGLIAAFDKVAKRAKELGRTVHIFIPDTNYKLPPNVEAPGFRADLSKDFTKDREQPRLADHSTLCWNNLFGPEGILRPYAEAGLVTFSLVKVLRYAGIGYDSEIAAGLDYCLKANTGSSLDITSMSFGGTRRGSYADVLEEFSRQPDSGKVLIAAAGNAGDDGSGDTMRYPAKLKGVIAVGAYDERRLRASFSSIGQALTVIGPGHRTPSRNYENQKVAWSGTSSSAPNVGGVTAVLGLYWVEVDEQPFTNSLLTRLATDLNEPGHDIYTGYGAVPIDPYLEMDPAPDPDPDPDPEPEPPAPDPEPDNSFKLVVRLSERPVFMRWKADQQAGPWNIVLLEAPLFQIEGKAADQVSFLKAVDALIADYWAIPQGMVGFTDWTPAEAARWALHFMHFYARDRGYKVYPLQATGFAPAGAGFEIENHDLDKGRGRLPTTPAEAAIIAASPIVKMVRIK